MLSAADLYYLRQVELRVKCLTYNRHGDYARDAGSNLSDRPKRERHRGRDHVTPLLEFLFQALGGFYAGNTT